MTDPTVAGPVVEVRGNMRGIPESDSSDEASEGSVSIETSEIAVAGLPPTPPALNGDTSHYEEKKASTSVANITRLGQQPRDDAFGIAYKPSCGASSPGYDLPSGPAFVDEDAFEEEMDAEFRVPGFSDKSFQKNITRSATAPRENSTMMIDVETNSFLGDNEEGADTTEQQVSCREYIVRNYQKRTVGFAQ